MRTCLLTCDPYVIATVQEVAPDVVIQRHLDSQSMEADLCIWDLDLDAQIPADFSQTTDERQIVFLVNPKNLQSVDPALLANSCALVKPVNAFTVRAFLDLATRTCRLSQKANQADQLRSDREALVQYALATNLRLQEYDHQRTNFLARALHDLRAPLTALHGYCGLLADGKLGPVSPEQRELFSRMQSSTRRLSRQATGMFELTVLGRVRRQPQWTAAEIDDAVAQAIYEVHPMLQDKEQNIAASLSPADKTFLFDSEQITQVVMNILENCCSFTPGRGSIDIRGYNVMCDFSSESASRAAIPSTGESNGYRLDIQDNGPGIQPDLLSAIFEQYTSYSGGRDRSGGGLGLAICKMLVTAHQGFIWADNGQQGAVFSIVLPFRPRSLPSQVDAASQSHLTCIVN